MVIGEDTVVPGGVQKGITPKNPEELKREEKRIPHQNPPLDEPGTPSIPGTSEPEEPDQRRDVRGALPMAEFPLPEDIEWALAGDPEGEPIIEGPITPEPEIDELGPDRDVRAPLPREAPVIDPEGELSITPEPDRSPGAPPAGPPGFPTPDTPEPDPAGHRH